jgi:hypothetical protein
MTTFTSDDREEEYKKILAEDPNQPGYEDAVPNSSAEDIKALKKGLEFFHALKGNNASPPHIVDSGASVIRMNAYELADALDWVCENHLVGIGDADFKVTAIMLRHQADKIADLQTTIKFLEEECKALRGQVNT